jgi:CheY-like chemotaxis protein
MDGSRTPSILLVEDDPGDVILVREALANPPSGRSIEVARDGVEALARLRDPAQPLPDLVLLDLNLPRKDGREVLAEIRGDPRLRMLTVVVLSTSEAHLDIARSYELHANAYVTKPVELESFRRVVREIDHFFLAVAKLPPLQ